MLALPLDVGAVEWVDGGGEATVLLPECSLDFPLALSEFPSLFLDFSMDTSRQVGRSVGAYTMCLV